MSTDDRIRRKRIFKNPMMILSITMTVVFIGLGLFLLVQKDMLAGYNEAIRTGFPWLIILYGAFRAWRVYNDYFRNVEAG